jgi:hypothetical protein
MEALGFDATEERICLRAVELLRAALPFTQATAEVRHGWVYVWAFEANVASVRFGFVPGRRKLIFYSMREGKDGEEIDSYFYDLARPSEHVWRIATKLRSALWASAPPMRWEAYLDMAIVDTAKEGDFGFRPGTRYDKVIE